MVETTNPQAPDIAVYARTLWRHKLAFLAVVVVIPVAAYFVAARSPKVYESSVLMNVQASPVDTTLFTSQNTGPSSQSIAIAARLIQTKGVAQAAASKLAPPGISPGALLGAIAVTTDPNTGFVTITASAGKPQRAADIANAFGAAVTSNQAQQAIEIINRTISGATAQLNALPRSARVARNQLTGQIQRLRALRAAQGTNAQVLEPATPPGSPVAPHPLQATALALVVAVLLAVTLVAVLEGLDRRVRRPEEAEELSGLPLLSSVPASAFNGPVETPPVAEAFRGLRASLRFFNVDRDIRSIVVTSARKGDGKTLVAVNLARACARAGADVILVDADLRRPMIATRLGLTNALRTRGIELTGTSVGEGMVGVLVGNRELGDELQDCETGEHGGGRLRVLPAWEPPPNPSELLGSLRMARLIEELSSKCELVLFDTSPLLAVSDALPLLDRVSGTLLVARLGVTHRDELRHMRGLLTAAEGAALGIVATGAEERGAYPYSAYYRLEAESPPSLNGNSTSRSRLHASWGRRPSTLFARRRH